MPSIYQLKPTFQNQLRPLVNQLAQQGITPNQITLSAVGLSLITGGIIAIWPQSPEVFWLIPITLFIRMALNAIDGMLAREHAMITPLGSILNELGDVISDAALYLPFSLIPGSRGVLLVPVVILALFTEMAGILGVTLGGQRRYDGPMGKSDRAFVFGFISLCLALGLTPGLWLELVWLVMVVLLVWTIINRVKSTLSDLDSHDLESTTE